MEVLTKVFNQLMRLGSFNLHPKCKDPQITSLIFSNDLVVFTKPDMPSITTIFKGLGLFYSITGLKVDIIVVGISDSHENLIYNATTFKPRNDFLNYQGLHLATSRTMDATV